MITAQDARRLTDEANALYTAQEVHAFIEDRAKMGFKAVRFTSRRWNSTVNHAVIAAGFSVAEDAGQIVVSW